QFFEETAPAPVAAKPRAGVTATVLIATGMLFAGAALVVGISALISSDEPRPTVALTPPPADQLVLDADVEVPPPELAPVIDPAQYDAGQTSQAETSAGKVLEIDAENGRALMLLATIHLEQGKREKASAELRRYLAVDPTGPYAADAKLLLNH